MGDSHHPPAGELLLGNRVSDAAYNGSPEGGARAIERAIKDGLPAFEIVDETTTPLDTPTRR